MNNQQHIQTKLNTFNSLLTKALQQNNSTLFKLSIGILLEIQGLMFPTENPQQTTSVETIPKETLTTETTTETSQPNNTKEESE